MQVGSAVLLLSRFVGLQWNADEALRLAEEKTASASEAVDRLSDNVGTLEQRLTAGEEPTVEDAKGEPAATGGATPTRPSPAGAGTAGLQAMLAEGGGGNTVPDGTGDGIISSPSLPQNKSVEAAAGAAPVAAEAKVGGARRSSSDRDGRSGHSLQQPSTAESARKRRPSSSSQNGADEELGEDVASPSGSGRLRDDVSVGDGDGEQSEGSSASSATGPGRRYNGAPGRDIDSDDERASSRRRSSSGGGGDGEGRRKNRRSRRSAEGHPIDQALQDPATEQGVLSLSSSRGKDDEQVLQRPSTSRLSPLRRSRASAAADDIGDGKDTVGTNLNPAPQKEVAGGAAVTTVLAEDGKEQVPPGGGRDLGADTNGDRLPVSAGDSTLSSPPAEQTQQAREASAATEEASSKMLNETVGGEGAQHREELRRETTGDNASSAASEGATVADGATPAVSATGEVDGSVGEKSDMEEEDGSENERAEGVEGAKLGGARPTNHVASSAAATATASPRNSTSISETPRADESALSASARKETLVAVDHNGAEDIHGSGRRQDEEKRTTPYAPPQVVTARNPGTTTMVKARSISSSTSESVVVGSAGETAGGVSAVQEGADKKVRNGDTDDDEARVRGDGEHGRSNSAAGKPGSSAAGAPGPEPLGEEVHGSSSLKGFLPTTADRTFDASKAASSSIKLQPLEPRSMGGGSAEGAVEVLETARRAGRIHGSSASHDARGAKTRASKEKEDEERAERHMSNGRLSARGQKAESSAAPSRSAETRLAPVVSEASDKRGDVGDGGSGGGRSFSDDCSHTSSGSSWTSRTGDSRSACSEQSTAASTHTSTPSKKGRAADSAAVKRSNSGSSSSGGRRRRSRSRSKKNQVPADGVGGGVAGREDTIGAQADEDRPKMGVVSDKRRGSDRHVEAVAANIVATAVAAAHPPRRGSSSVSMPPSGPGVADHELEVKTGNDG